MNEWNRGPQRQCFAEKESGKNEKGFPSPSRALSLDPDLLCLSRVLLLLLLRTDPMRTSNRLLQNLRHGPRPVNVRSLPLSATRSLGHRVRFAKPERRCPSRVPTPLRLNATRQKHKWPTLLRRVSERTFGPRPWQRPLRAFWVFDQPHRHPWPRTRTKQRALQLPSCNRSPATLSLPVGANERAKTSPHSARTTKQAPKTPRGKGVAFGHSASIEVGRNAGLMTDYLNRFGLTRSALGRRTLSRWASCRCPARPARALGLATSRS